MTFEDLNLGDAFTSTKRPHNTYVRMHVCVAPDFPGEPGNCCDVFSGESYRFQAGEIVTRVPMPDVPMTRGPYGVAFPQRCIE